MVNDFLGGREGLEPSVLGPFGSVWQRNVLGMHGLDVGDYGAGSRLQDDGCGRHAHCVRSRMLTSRALPASPSVM